MLIHIGRRTAKRRYTVLEIMEYRAKIPEMVVMSAFGRNADWLRNIEPRQKNLWATSGSGSLPSAWYSAVSVTWNVRKP